MARSLWIPLLSVLLLSPPAWAQGDMDLPLASPGKGGKKGGAAVLSVLQAKAKGGPNLKGPVGKLIEGPLKKSGFALLPAAKLTKAAKQAKVKPKELATPAGAKMAGEKAGVANVLIIESFAEQQTDLMGKKKKVMGANVTLVDVGRGSILFTRKYMFKGKTLEKDISADIIKEITILLSPTAAPPPEPAPAEEPPPPPPDAPPPPEYAPLAAEPGAEEPLPGTPGEGSVDASASAPASTGQPDPLAAPAYAEPAPTGAAEPAPTTVAMAEPQPEVVEQAPPPAPERSGRWRPGMHFLAGAMFLTRTARITSEGASQTPPCFCSADPSAFGPVFPAGYVNAEIYPLAFGGKGAFYEGIGLHMDGMYTQVQTIINTAGDTLTSSVWQARGGLSYRFVWWDSEIAPDFRLDAGLSYFEFPLKSGAFPGVKYFGEIYVGGQFDVPLFTKYASFIAGGSYTILMEPSGKTKRLGDSVSSQTTFEVRGGFRGGYSLFEAAVLVRYERWQQSYNGQTTLALPVQFQNATLTDEIMGAMVAVGVKL